MAAPGALPLYELYTLVPPLALGTIFEIMILKNHDFEMLCFSYTGCQGTGTTTKQNNAYRDRIIFNQQNNVSLQQDANKATQVHQLSFLLRKMGFSNNSLVWGKTPETTMKPNGLLQRKK